MSARRGAAPQTPRHPYMRSPRLPRLERARERKEERARESAHSIMLQMPSDSAAPRHQGKPARWAVLPRGPQTGFIRCEFQRQLCIAVPATSAPASEWETPPAPRRSGRPGGPGPDPAERGRGGRRSPGPGRAGGGAAVVPQPPAAAGGTRPGAPRGSCRPAAAVRAPRLGLHRSGEPGRRRTDANPTTSRSAARRSVLRVPRPRPGAPGAPRAARRQRRAGAGGTPPGLGPQGAPCPAAPALTFEDRAELLQGHVPGGARGRAAAGRRRSRPGWEAAPRRAHRGHQAASPRAALRSRGAPSPRPPPAPAPRRAPPPASRRPVPSTGPEPSGAGARDSPGAGPAPVAAGAGSPAHLSAERERRVPAAARAGPAPPAPPARAPRPRGQSPLEGGASDPRGALGWVSGSWGPGVPGSPGPGVAVPARDGSEPPPREAGALGERHRLLGLLGPQFKVKAARLSPASPSAGAQALTRHPPFGAGWLA